MYKYKLNNKIIDFKSSNIKSFSPTIKKILKREGINIYEHLENLGFNLKLCNICKTTYNPNFKLIFKILDNNIVKICDVKWGKSSYNFKKYDKHYCYGSNRNCPGLKMNPNSVEFISKTLNLNEDDALSYIYENNKSPFYSINHDSIEDYSKSQSRGKDYYISKYGQTEGLLKYESNITKFKYTNSKISYTDKYGQTEGLKIWDKISKKKAITLANLQLKYGKSNGIDRYNNWINTCSISNIELIDKYGKDEGLKRIKSRNNKRIQSLIENGHVIIPKELRFEYMIYSQLVWDETKYNILIHGSDQFGIDTIKSNLTIDHRLSIKSGFISGVNPDIIGNIENIEYITKSKNSSKRANNSIELNDLLSKIKTSKYGE